jgi:DNA repair exonuclease SbcCD ATPase subunit
VRSERESIESDECLQHYLETEEIDLDRLDKNVAIQLGQVERAIEQQVLDLWSGLLEQGQTIEYLELHGLLPPSQDVRLVLDLLERNGITAWSGWKYISENLSSEQIRDFIQRLPGVVLGAIVQTSHYEKAKQVLSTTNLTLSGPIVLADQNIIDNKKKVPTWTTGPSSNAYFDRDEARSELDNRKSKCDREQQDLDTKRQELIALRSSISRLVRFRQQYPTEWIVAQQDVIDSSIEKQKSYQVELTTLNEKQQRLKSEINSQHQRQQDLMAELAILREHLARLQEYVDRFPIELSVLKQNYDELIDTAKMQKESMASCISNAEELEQQAISASTEVNKNVKQTGSIERELSEIKYGLDRPLISETGDLYMLIDTYNSLLISYEREVGMTELQLAIENAKKDVIEARNKFNDKLTKGLREKVVRNALNLLTDASDVETRYEEARKFNFQAAGALDKKKNKLEQANQQFDQFDRQCTSKSLTNEFANLDREQLELKANEEQFHAQELESTGLIKTTAAQIAQLQSAGLRDCIKTLENELAKIIIIFSGAEDLWQVSTDQTRPELDWAPPSDNDVAARLTAFQEQLRQIRVERKKLDATSKSIEQTVQKWLEDCQSRHANLSNSVRKLKVWLTQDYEQLCDRFCEELNLRLKSIQESLLEVDRHRDEIVEQTLGAAKAGIDTLNALTKQSKLPPSLTHFGERSFLKIRLNDPVDLAERKSRIEQLIDDIIDATKVPSGIELAQQAVRRLAKPIRIEVLFPDADSSRAAYIPIADMKKQSGGEYLTSAILIYCTLARVRANNRGDRLDKTSTLLLDNPIGKASRPKFLELQREVARAMNIQLIFTTGIDDLEALSIFPNIIRLRNERQDPATGEKILEMEPAAGSIEAARLQITADRDNSKT